MLDFCTTNLVQLILFFIKAIEKICLSVKCSRPFKATWDLYWVRNRSSCGLIWPLHDYKLPSMLTVKVLRDIGGCGFQWPVKDKTGPLRWWARKGLKCQERWERAFSFLYVKSLIIFTLSVRKATFAFLLFFFASYVLSINPGWSWIAFF
jgi:hypothetical protein